MLARLWIVLLGTCLSVSVYADQFTKEEQGLWELEETYWRHVQAGNVDGYLSLWHEDFVGWPCTEWSPTDKSQIGNWVQRIRDEDTTLTYSLRPQAVRLFGDVGIVHYAVEYVFEYRDGTVAGAGKWRRFTHTWMKVGDQWQIITGMCAAREPARSKK